MNILANNQYEINRKKVVIASGGTLGVEWGGYADGGPYFDTDVILGSPSIYVDGVKQDLNKDYTFLEKRITWIGTPPEEGRRISGYSTNTSEADTKMSKVVFSEAEGNLSDGQTVFTFAYTPRYIDVMLNGIELIDGVDFTADNGDYLTLNTGLTLSDTLVIKVIGIFTVNDLYDKTEIDLKIGTETINQQKADKLLTVGSGGDYVTINEALEEASKAYPLYKQGGYSVEIKLLAGFVMQEQVIVKGIDLGYITITGEDDETAIQRDALITNIQFDSTERFPAFTALNNATLPVIGQLFHMDDSGESSERSGILCAVNSKVSVLEDCGVTSAGQYGLVCYRNSLGVAKGAIFKDAAVICIYSYTSKVECQGADCSGAQYGVKGVYASQISALNVNATNSSVLAVYCYGSSNMTIRYADCSNSDKAIYASTAANVDASFFTATDCTDRPVQANYNSIINCVNSNVSCTDSSLPDYDANNGSLIDISGATGDTDTGETVNEWGAGGSVTS